MQTRRVMIDGYNLALEKGTGVATYSRNLSLELSNLGHKIDLLYGLRSGVSKNPLLSEIGFFDTLAKPLRTPEIVRTMIRSPFGLTARQVPITGKVVAKNPLRILPVYDRIFNCRHLYGMARRHFRLYGSFMDAAYEQSAAIAHWTYPLPVRLKGAANIYTIHDLVPLRLPYTTLDNKREYYRTIREIVRKADHIVTVSEASKRDILDLFDVPEDRVTNTYQSVSLPRKILDRSFDDVCSEVEAIFGLDPKKYFLFFGAIEPKKNVGRIIEAYLASQSKLPLVIVGQVTWHNANDLRLIEVSNTRKIAAAEKRERGEMAATETAAGGQILRLDYLPLNLLTSLIRSARAVVFPSLYEGFGLPILEAMQLGTAVITGTQGSNPEVAGDSAYLVDPYDVTDIAKAIRDLDNDTQLVQNLETLGKKRADVFSPQNYAERLRELYSRL